MASFLAVPLKKTSEIDLVKHLKYVFSSFCVAADEPVSYDDAINELNKLRMNSTWRTLDKHESSLDVMTRYYDQLNYLDAKCPSVDFQISFKWKDAFDKGSFFMSSASLTLSTLAYEKACILFNIGAMQSQVACSHISDTKNDEGLKLAAKYFQMASGAFQHLKSLASSGIEDPTPDLRSDTISALQALMLAQAQESFFFKATSDNMKESIIAKVASRAEELYSDTLKLMQKETVHHLWEKDWIPIVAGKQVGFQALAEYYQSLVCKTKKDVGEEISRLQKALELMKNAEAKGILAPDFKDYMAKMNHNYEESKKDNDFIYHARIPEYKSLAPIGKAALAKPIMPGEKLNSDSQDMFSALLPMAVQQAMSAFDLRKSEIVNGEKAKLQGETQMLNGILASLNLPAAIEDTTGNCLPQSLKEKAEAIQGKGGLETIQHLLNELPSLLQRNGEILKECERMLNDEEESDNELRSKFGSNWVRTPSTKLNEPLKSNLQKYKQIISTAMSADGIVKEKYETHREKMALLCLPEDQLLSSVPTGNPVTSCSSVDQLKRLMREVDILKSERETLIGELESAAVDMRAKFLSALSSEGVNEEALSVETLGEIYGPIQKQVRENICRQEQLVQNIQSANNEFSKEKNSDGSGASRDKMLSDLAAAHDAYMELLGNLEEGSTFYNNLTEVLVNFQNKINDFCFARKTEKDELCKELQKNIVSVATQPSPLQPPSADASKQKPARPPPPKTEPANIAPPNWNVPASYRPNEPIPGAPQPMNMPQGQPEGQLPYPAYPAYPAYPYPAAPYNPYGQILMPPFPPAPGYQGQHQPYPYQPTGSYPYPQAQQQYPYPQQQYRPQ